MRKELLARLDVHLRQGSGLGHRDSAAHRGALGVSSDARVRRSSAKGPAAAGALRAHRCESRHAWRDTGDPGVIPRLHVADPPRGKIRAARGANVGRAIPLILRRQSRSPPRGW
jgi:hypothetical protein